MQPPSDPLLPPPNPVVHLELHTRDLNRACEFYAGLCGWRPELIDVPSGTYNALETGTAGLGGGIVECRSGGPLWLPYVQVADVARATARAEALGARVLLQPREGPAGWRGVVADPGGGEVAFWQPKRS